MAATAVGTTAVSMVVSCLSSSSSMSAPSSLSARFGRVQLGGGGGAGRQWQHCGWPGRPPSKARLRVLAAGAAVRPDEQTIPDRRRDQQQHEGDRQQAAPPLLDARDLSFQPAGSAAPILQKVSLQLQRGQLGLIVGRSGSGKSTLLQLLAGLTSPTAGQVLLEGRPADTKALQTHVGLVFQFPERHFLCNTLIEELLWPVSPRTVITQPPVIAKLQAAAEATGLQNLAFDTSPRALSDGYKRRLALAVQLVRGPSILLLDEPLAGLDWRVRKEVVQLLMALKSHCTVLVVSHDLRELTPLVDQAWRMQPGGMLQPEPWPAS
eukprot:jgi/Chlat1/7154/Chrsp57S06823